MGDVLFKGSALILLGDKEVASILAAIFVVVVVIVSVIRVEC